MTDQLEPAHTARPTDPVPPGVGVITSVPWRRLLGYLRPHVLPFGAAIVALLVSTGAALLLPLAVGGLVGAVQPGPATRRSLDQVVLLLVVLAVVLAVAGFVQGYLLGVIGERIVARLRSQLYARLVTLPPGLPRSPARRGADLAAVAAT